MPAQSRGHPPTARLRASSPLHHPFFAEKAAVHPLMDFSARPVRATPALCLDDNRWIPVTYAQSDRCGDDFDDFGVSSHLGSGFGVRAWMATCEGWPWAATQTVFRPLGFVAFWAGFVFKMTPTVLENSGERGKSSGKFLENFGSRQRPLGLSTRSCHGVEVGGGRRPSGWP